MASCIPSDVVVVSINTLRLDHNKSGVKVFQIPSAYIALISQLSFLSGINVYGGKSIPSCVTSSLISHHPDAGSREWKCEERKNQTTDERKCVCRLNKAYHRKMYFTYQCRQILQKNAFVEREGSRCSAQQRRGKPQPLLKSNKCKNMVMRWH